MVDHEPSILAKALRAPKGRKGTLGRVTPEQFERLKKWTRKAADLPRGVRVYCKLDANIDPGFLAWTARVRDNPMSYTIRVNADVSYWHCADLILHEFVHVRQWLLYGQDVSDHGPEYGREWSHVYMRWTLETPANPMVCKVK